MADKSSTVRSSFDSLGTQSIISSPQQSGVKHEIASFLNNKLEFATHHRKAKVLKKESHRNLSKNIHISHWKQLREPLVHLEHLISKLPQLFPRTYTQEEGWIYPFIPPKVGEDPRGPEYAREEPFADFFTQFTTTCATATSVPNNNNKVNGRVWRSNHNTLIDKRRKPDLVLLDNSFQTFAENWEHVRSICQIKYKDTPELVEDAYEQLYDNAFFIFSKQDNRLFFIGFTMCGANLRAYMFHRGGTIGSTPMSLHTDPGFVAQALVAIAYGSFESIGYDPTVTTPEFSASIVPRWILTYAKPPNATVSFVSLKIDTCLFSSHSVQGRGTRVFACFHPKYKEFSKDANMGKEGKGKGKKSKTMDAPYEGPTHLIVKDCWVDHADRCDSVIHMLLKVRNKDLRERNGERNAEFQEPPGIAVYSPGQVDAVTLPKPNSDLHIDTNFQYFDDSVRAKVAIRQMIHKRFFFDTCGVALPWFATIEELLNVIHMAVQGHENALKHSILHRDVSLPNILIAVNSIDKESAVPDEGMAMRPGFLADWGLAIDLLNARGDFDESRLHFRTGTYPYLSTELMFGADGNRVKHRACDDLESFFWILWIMSVNYDGPFNVTRNWTHIEHLVAELATEEDNSSVDLHGTELAGPKVGFAQPDTELTLPDTLIMVPGTPSWMEDIPTPATTTTAAPPPISTSPSTSNPTPDETVAQRLRKGLQAQRNVSKMIWKDQLIDDKTARRYCVGNFASLTVPAWAKPGGHAMEYQQVAMEKATISWEMMEALITPYFAKPPFLKGMRRLLSLFKGDISIDEGQVFWSPPRASQVPTHAKVTDILKEMLDGMKGHDTYPDALQIKDGRQRYDEFLKRGRFPSFPTPTGSAAENKKKRPLKVAGNLPVSSSEAITLGSIPSSVVSSGKRGFDSLELTDGSAPKKNPRTK